MVEPKSGLSPKVSCDFEVNGLIPKINSLRMPATGFLWPEPEVPATLAQMGGLPDSLMYLPKVTSCCDFKANSLSPKWPDPDLPLRLQSDWPKPKSDV